jgi:hypothetical protein
MSRSSVPRDADGPGQAPRAMIDALEEALESLATEYPGEGT